MTTAAPDEPAAPALDPDLAMLLRHVGPLSPDEQITFAAMWASCDASERALLERLMMAGNRGPTLVPPKRRRPAPGP